MVLQKNKSRGDKSRFFSFGTNSNRNKENISSDDSEFGSDVSFGWKKIRTNSDTEKIINLENMASGSESDNSDNDSSNGEPSEYNAADESENENEIKIKDESISQSEESDVDNTSSEEETGGSGNTKAGVTINNTGVTEESSDSDDLESNDNDQQESLKVPDNYVPFQMSGGLVLEHISDDDEVWMVQCPVFITPEDLNGKDLMFGGTSEFSIKQKNGEEQLYETASYTDMNRSVSCLLPSRNSRHLAAKVIEPAGLIVIKEKICVPDFDDDPVPKARNFNIPKDLKIRHPLFGSGYEEELDARKTQVEDSVKKKKKKHKAKDKSDTIHKRKREMSDDETECTSASKRQKVEEEEELSAEASEERDTENSNKHKKKKKKKSKSRDFENQNLNIDESISKKKKKKSKNRETEDFNTQEIIVKEEIEQEVESEENLPKKKKKHKKKSRDVLDAATE